MKIQILYVILAIVILVAIIFLFVYFRHKSSSIDKYTITEAGEFKKDPNGIISKEYYDFLQNPKYDKTAPTQADVYLLGTEYYRTDKYYSEANNYFVVRRGFPFVIMKDPNLNWDMDNFKLYRHKTVNNSYKKFTKKDFIDHDANNIRLIEKKYNYTSMSPDPDDTVKVVKRTKDYIIFYTEPDAAIGKYTLNGFPCLKASCKDWQTSEETSNSIDIYLICNPYHKNDVVYIPDENLIQNYVLEENGLNHQGTSDEKTIAYWDYDQFNYNCIDGAFKLYYFLSSFNDFEPNNIATLARDFSFGVNAVIISGLWPTPEQQETLDIFRKSDASIADQANLQDNFNKPFTSCTYNSDCENVFTNGPNPPLINNSKITEHVCAPALNVPSKYQSEIPKVCGLDPANPFQLPYIPAKNNAQYYKTCAGDTDCANLKDWDGSNNTNSFDPIKPDQKSQFKPKCLQQNICAVDIWNGGVNPQKLPQSSTPILANYVKNYTKTKWGECWVYAGVMTSLFRTLGIPCRQISAYQVFRQYCSEIPDNNNQQVCKDGMGKFTGICKADKNKDNSFKATNGFLWSFHMWNNIWFNRQDFKDEFKSYNGPDWQIVDATPQELSFGVNQLGPCPLKCLKDRFMNNQILYDSCFLNTEINYVIDFDNQKYDTQCEVYTQALNIDFSHYKGLLQFNNPQVMELLMKNINDEYVSKSSIKTSSEAIKFKVYERLPYNGPLKL